MKLLFKRPVRIAILLFILLLVGLDALLTRWRTTDWDQSLLVVIHPINGDLSDESARFISYLTELDVKPVERYLNSEAARYGLALSEPFMVRLASELQDDPPPPPRDGAFFATVWWSLKMRYWGRQFDSFEGLPVQIKVFARYHSFAEHLTIDHSMGLEKGHICIVNAYASPLMMNRNQVIIAHEILHTLGASDKYDPASEMPLYPDGYGDPHQSPLLPQQRAELMAGYLPLGEAESVMAASLAETLIGPRTALEIGWLNDGTLSETARARPYNTN